MFVGNKAGRACRSVVVVAGKGSFSRPAGWPARQLVCLPDSRDAVWRG
jgi:hypothetical protein